MLKGKDAVQRDLDSLEQCTSTAGLYQKDCGQQVGGGDSHPLLCSFKTPTCNQGWDLQHSKGGS